MRRLLAAVVLATSALAARAEEGLAERRANPVEDQATDAVCGTAIRKSAAPFSESSGGRAFWFCSKDCHALFVADPAKFGGAKEAAAGDAPAPAAKQPPTDETAVRNSEWRSLLHTASQVRQAAMTLMVLALTLVSVVMLGGLVLFTAGLAPNAVARSSVATRDHPVRCFAIGTVVLLLGSIATVVTKGLLGVVVAPVVVSALLIGLAGVSEHLGRNVWHLAGKEGNRVGHLLAGWGTFSLVALVPLVGWFGFLPYYAAVGVGSFFAGLMGGRRADTPGI